MTSRRRTHIRPPLILPIAHFFAAYNKIPDGLEPWPCTNYIWLRDGRPIIFDHWLISTDC
jgi:hypothetical protein